MFEGIVGNVGELRTDITTGTVYRYNGTEWIVNGTGVSSSATFPTTGITVGDIREDIKTGGKFRWNGTTWLLITTAKKITKEDLDPSLYYLLDSVNQVTNKTLDSVVEGMNINQTITFEEPIKINSVSGDTDLVINTTSSYSNSLTVTGAAGSAGSKTKTLQVEDVAGNIKEITISIEIITDDGI